MIISFYTKTRSPEGDVRGPKYVSLDTAREAYVASRAVLKD